MNFKELRRYLRFRMVTGLPGILRVLPESWGRALCVWIGWGGYVLVEKDRRLAQRNLSRVHPGWPVARVRLEARRVFEEIGRNVFDFVRYPELSPECRRALVRVEGREHLDRLCQQGRGAVLVTAHLGCWEILAAALVERGYPLRPVARPLGERRLEEALRRHRARMGTVTLSSRGSLRPALRHVRRGGFLGILADQRVREGGQVVRFLGQRTRMIDSPARLSLGLGVPLLPVGIRRGPDQTHVCTVLPSVDTGPKADVGSITQAVAESLEGLIRAAPTQWIWIHPRWEDTVRVEESRSAPDTREKPGVLDTDEERPVCVVH